jgi:hypothetical protein
VAGAASVKAKDYEQRGDVTGRNEYEAWQSLKESGSPLEVGDLLESENGQLRVCKYVGFEPAQWFIPEPKVHSELEPASREPVT